MSGILDRILQEAERIGNTPPHQAMINGIQQRTNNVVSGANVLGKVGGMGWDNPGPSRVEDFLRLLGTTSLGDVASGGVERFGASPDSRASQGAQYFGDTVNRINPVLRFLQTLSSMSADTMSASRRAPEIKRNVDAGFQGIADNLLGREGMPRNPVDSIAPPGGGQGGGQGEGNQPPAEPDSTTGESANPYDATPQSVIALRKLAAQNQEGVPSRDTINNNMMARNQGQMRGMPAAVPGWAGSNNRPTSAAQINGRPNWAHVMNPNAPRTEMVREPGSARPQGDQFNPEVNQQRIADDWAVRNANVAAEREAAGVIPTIDVSVSPEELEAQLAEAGAYEKLAAAEFDTEGLTPLQVAAAWNAVVRDINQAKRVTSSSTEEEGE